VSALATLGGYRPRSVESDPLRDSRHPHAKAAREQAAWLSWLELGGTAPATLYRYQLATERLLEAYPDMDFAEFTDAELLHILKGFPQKSRAVRMAAYSSWFKWALKTRRIPVNPMDYLPDIRRAPQPVIDIFTVAEENALCSLPSPDGHLLTVLFEAGLRKAEAMSIRRKRFNFDAEEVNIIEGAKGGRQRVVPMSASLAKAITDLTWLEGLDPDDHLWATRPGGGQARRDLPIGETSFVRWWGRCIQTAGVRYRKPHTTRHTFATRWRQQGLALDDLQLLMGHASIQTTSDMYVHTKVADVAKRMKALGGKGS